MQERLEALNASFADERILAISGGSPLPPRESVFIAHDNPPPLVRTSRWEARLYDGAYGVDEEALVSPSTIVLH